MLMVKMVREGVTRREIFLQPGVPSRWRFYEWLDDSSNKVGEFTLRELWDAAYRDRADALFDEAIEIADDGRNDTYIDEEGNRQVDYDVIARSRLRVDTRKWAASKLNPARYGDVVRNEISGPGGGPVAVQAVPRDQAAIEAVREAFARQGIGLVHDVQKG